MFNFFKKRNTANAIQNWQIPVDSTYRLIKNADSIQFANADESVVLYFSMLGITNNSLLQEIDLAKMQPSVTRKEKGWLLEGTKSSGNNILVCVFSFTNQSDEDLLKELFDDIVYSGK